MRWIQDTEKSVSLPLLTMRHHFKSHVSYGPENESIENRQRSSSRFDRTSWSHAWKYIVLATLPTSSRKSSSMWFVPFNAGFANKISAKQLSVVRMGNITCRIVIQLSLKNSPCCCKVRMVAWQLAAPHWWLRSNHCRESRTRQGQWVSTWLKIFEQFLI